MKIKRTLWLDILKIIACFLVIVNHAGGYVLGNNPSKITIIFYCVNFAICKIAVPIFIMVTGSLLLKKESSYNDITKKIIRIVIPLIFISAIIYYKSNGINIIGFIKNFIEEPIIYPYWYLYMLISLYLVTPLLQKMIKNFNNKDYEHLFIICLAIPTLIDLFNALLNIKINTLFYICNFSKIVGIYILGYFLTTCDLKKNAKNIAVVAFPIIIMMFFLTLYIPYINTEKISYAFDSYDTVFSIGASAMLFYIVRYYFDTKRVNSKIANIINLVSECTFGIYLFHYLIIHYIYYSNTFQLIFNFNKYIGIYLLEISVFVISGIFTYALRQIPYIKKYL